MFRAPRGMQDILPDDQPYWRQLTAQAADIAHRYGYRRIDTPILESTNLFQRGVGDSTDIVEKEMYSFLDKGDNPLTLRPEATAAVCRAYLEHGMGSWVQPVKLYAVGPFFRYDRPQAGRYRQFHQFNVEAIGEADAALDAEVIDMSGRFLREAGLREITLLVNSIGDRNCRPSYIAALQDYFTRYRDDLCKDCQSRLDRNPLRLLDCKVPACQRIGDAAPRSVDFLCAECAEHYQQLIAYLRRLNLPWHEDHRLVRGFDYYTRTVFEYQPSDVGGQSAVGGGGRYDGLIEQLGGKPTPAIGFAVGLERIILNLRKAGAEVPADAPPVAYIAALGQPAREEAMRLAAQLRDRGLATLSTLSGRSLKAQLRHADSSGARFAVVLGDDELAQRQATVRTLATGEQQRLALDDLPAFLAGA